MDILEEWGMEDMEDMGNGGAGPVIQEPVDTGNQHLDKAINKFYNCLSHDPPTVQQVVITKPYSRN